MGKRQRPVLSSSLRRRKEERLARKSTDIPVPLNPVNMRRVIRELQAARIELEKRDQEPDASQVRTECFTGNVPGSL